MGIDFKAPSGSDNSPANTDEAEKRERVSSEIDRLSDIIKARLKAILPNVGLQQIEPSLQILRDLATSLENDLSAIAANKPTDLEAARERKEAEAFEKDLDDRLEKGIRAIFLLPRKFDSYVELEEALDDINIEVFNWENTAFLQDRRDNFRGLRQPFKGLKKDTRIHRQFIFEAPNDSTGIVEQYIVGLYSNINDFFKPKDPKSAAKNKYFALGKRKNYEQNGYPSTVFFLDSEAHWTIPNQDLSPKK